VRASSPCTRIVTKGPWHGKHLYQDCAKSGPSGCRYGEWSAIFELYMVKAKIGKDDFDGRASSDESVLASTWGGGTIVDAAVVVLNVFWIDQSFLSLASGWRLSDDELIVYGLQLDELARHVPFPRHVLRQRRTDPEHHPEEQDRRQQYELLRQTFAELGPIGQRFFEGLLAAHRQGKAQARQILALRAHYHQHDLVAAMSVHGYRVCYRTSAKLVRDLAKRRVDDSLPKRLRYYGRFDLLVIDEFGFDRLERSDTPQASSLLYKVIEARYPGRSTALVTNIDFEAWSDYLGDPPLAMAFLDRVVDGAIAMKIEGKSYRAHRARGQDQKPLADQKPPADQKPLADQKPPAEQRKPPAE